MTDSTKISTLMDDARECEQPDAMVKRTGEQPQSSAESTANGVASNSITTTPSATTAPSSMSPVVLTSEDSSSKRPDDEEKQQQQASQAADATKEVAVTVKNHDDDRVFAQLARQLEYYFSCQNLAKDTYVQTLRKLNSGCVPVAILANFSKVKLLLSSSSEEEARVRAVLQACTDHSQGRLRVVSIDTGSGKIVTNNDSVNTILAIGTHDNEPLTISDDASMMATSPTSSKSVVFLPSSPLGGSGAANTLILRDVIPQVTEQDIQALFTFEGCPSVESIRQDVGNCWFVRLDTEDRLVMAQTMMHVQTLTLAGYPVHARLKASLTSSVSVDTAQLMPALAGAWVPDDARALAAKKSSRKKKRRSRKKMSNRSTNDSSEKDAKDSKNSDVNSSNIVVSPAVSSSSSPSVIPPFLDDDNFPTLHDKKVEWETISEQGSRSSKGDNAEEDKEREEDDDEEEEEVGDEEGINDEGEEDQRRSSSSYFKATFSSDGASTATTTSSSTESFTKKTTLVFPAVGGYAAALMTAPCLNRQQSGATSLTLATDKSKPQEMRSSATGALQGGGSSNVEDEIAAATAAGGPPPMVVQSPTWSQGRSFADILRKD